MNDHQRHAEIFISLLKSMYGDVATKDRVRILMMPKLTAIIPGTDIGTTCTTARSRA